MRGRLQFPLRSFDLAPPPLLEAAKRLFTLLRGQDRARSSQNYESEAPTVRPFHSNGLMSFAGTIMLDVATRPTDRMKPEMVVPTEDSCPLDPVVSVGSQPVN